MRIQDSLAAWMLDTAVTFFGVIIENALQERVEVGVGKSAKSQPRYTLTRLLHPEFRLPAREPEPELKPLEISPWQPFMAWIGKKGSKVKRYQYQKPVD